MRLRRLTFLALLACATRVQAQEPWVDPRLRLLQQRPAIAAEPAPAQPNRPPPLQRPGTLPHRPAFGVRTGPDGRAEVAVLVEMRDGGAVAEIRRLGGRVGRVVGRIASVRLPLSALPALTRLPSLTRIEASHALHLDNNRAAEASRVDEVRRREGAEFLGSTGEGVVFGVIDTGLDYGHGDFLDAAGQPRTVALWDQGRGLYCDSADLAVGGCATADVDGHGTHVTGIAAGDGSGVGDVEDVAYRYAGVAPAADIVAVRYSFLSDADLVEGVGWIFDQAAARGQPAVVNVSLGSQFGPHDGTSLLELGLDSLTGPGRIIVTSAGNEGNADNTTPALIQLLVHARARPAPGAPQTLTFQISDYTPRPDQCDDYGLLDLWYGSDQAITFTVVRPDGSRATATTGAGTTSEAAGGTVVIDAPAEPYPGNGDRETVIELSDCGTGGTPAPGTWRVELASDDVPSEPLDLWIAFSAFGSDGYALGQHGFDNTHVVGTPATARNLISVGAYTSRICWPSPLGDVCTQDVFGFRQPVGDIAFFSSAGPTRDGRLKPELAAPGMLLMSTRSASSSVSTQLLGPSRRHRVEMGTSMSSPHVAGAVALLLQHSPDLTPDSVRSILTTTAATDQWTAHDYSDGSTGTPNEQWGYGKLDARAALETQVDPAVAVDLWLSAASDTLPLGAELPIRGLVLNALGDSLAAPSAWSSSNPAVATVSADGVVTPVALGTATITATGGGYAATAFIEVVPPATLAVTASPLPAATTADSRAGTRLPLLDLQLAVDGFEGILVDTLGFRLAGRDPAARFLLVQDRDNDGTIDDADPVLADTVLALAGDTTLLRMTPDLVVPAQDTLDVIAALELSGAVPNGAIFQAVFLPDLTSSEGLRSGALDRRTGTGAAVASATSTTSVLQPGELFNLSENPIRSDARRLVLSFVDQPTVAAIYTLRGARVVDLLDRLDPSGLRAEWDLTTDRGGTVAPGIYFLIVRVGDQLIRRKLIVARAFGGDDA